MGELNPEIVIYGAGAIGSTVGGWLASRGKKVYFLDRGENVKVLKEKGLQAYLLGKKELSKAIPVNAITDLAERATADIVVLAVKNYDLEAAAKDIKSKMKKEPVIVTLQNGLVNQTIVPKYFSKVIFGVICYNAWRDAPNIFGYQHKGPIHFGVLDKNLISDRDRIVTLFSDAFPCIAEDRLVDAMKCKMLLILTNSITALIGLGVRKINDVKSYKNIVANVLYEGMQILMKAGVAEVKLETLPTWKTLKSAMTLPAFLSTIIFKKNIKKMQMSSMAQDKFILKSKVTEIESLNGFFVNLAESIGFDAKYNIALYKIARDEFAKDDFKPLDETDLWAKISKSS
nr:2-dehydropantoate 2-reductase [Candidatus Sigynarchaeota archaeon]